MKKTIVFLVVIAVLFVNAAHADVPGKVKFWLTGEVIALTLTAVLTILGSALGLVFRRISRTFKEVGELMTILGIALEDKRLTREELANIIKEGKDIFEVWK